MSPLPCPHCGKPVTLALTVGGGVAAVPPPAAATPAGLDHCPVHKLAWEHKSGVSKKTGKAYAFWACPYRPASADEKFCEHRPDDAWRPPAPGEL